MGLQNSGERSLSAWGRGGTPLYGLYGNMPLDRVWVLALFPNQGIYFCVCPKQGIVSTIVVIKYAYSVFETLPNSVKQ